MRQDVPTRATALGDMFRPSAPRITPFVREDGFINRCPRPPKPGVGPFAFTTYLTQLQWYKKNYPNCPTNEPTSGLGGLGAMTVSTQDRIITGLSFAVGPLALAGLFGLFKKPKLSATFAGLGIAAGTIGVVGAEWFQPAPGASPLENKGWVNGGPIFNDLAKYDQPLAFTDDPAKADDNTIIKTTIGSRAFDSSSRLNGLGGFWRPR